MRICSLHIHQTHQAFVPQYDACLRSSTLIPDMIEKVAFAKACRTSSSRHVSPVGIKLLHLPEGREPQAGGEEPRTPREIHKIESLCPDWYRSWLEGTECIGRRAKGLALSRVDKGLAFDVTSE